MALTATLAACATTNSTHAPTHNAQDTTFTQQMIIHHEGAIQMAELAVPRASSTQVKELAAQIEAAQQPEIDRMTSWLKGWGEPLTAPAPSSAPSATPDTSSAGSGTPSPTADGMAGMDMGTPSNMPGSDSSMPGMTPTEMISLATSMGTAFDNRFLTLMIEHHKGAIAMAKVELSKGASKSARALAENIATSQTKQIAEMQSLLITLG